MRIVTSDKVFSIDPTGIADGALAANYWAGFDSPSQTILTSGGLKYLGGAPSTDTAFITKASGRDQEISWNAAQTYQTDQVYLRYTGTEAVYISIAPTDNKFKAFFIKSAGRVSVTGAGGADAQVQYSFGMDSGGVSLTGLTGAFTPSVTDTWTVGCVGDLFYAKRNGVTFWTHRLWTHTRPGKIAMLIPYGGVLGLRAVTCTFKASVASYSDFDNKRFDFRDWGFKDSKTTGTIAGGSLTTLTVADATGFAVGDPIIVEIGGEAGAGEPETVGVGGTWPTYNYANAASLPDPATWCSSVANAVEGYAWVRDTVKVYRAYNPGSGYIWEEYSPVTQPRWYYANRVMPRALYATIVNKVGNVLTLNVPATVATTNANVYYDCTPAFKAFLAGDVNDGTIGGIITFSIRSNLDIVVQNGVYAIHGRIITPTTSGWRIWGSSRANLRWYSPKGTENFSIGHQGSDNKWYDMSWQAWAGTKYYCVDTDTAWFQPYHTIDCTGNANNGRGGEYNNRIDRIDFINTFGGSHFSNVTDSGSADCRGFQTNGNLQQYTTWFFQFAYGTNTWFDRLEYYGDKIGTAFEVFQANGGGFRDCLSVNGYFASNYSGGNYLIENFTQIVDANLTPANDWMSVNNFVFNLNVNIGEGANHPEIAAYGGRVVNPTITITQNAATGYIPSGIAVNTDVVAIRITGTHKAKPGQGVITFNRAAGKESFTASGISSNEPVTVTGIRVKGNSTQSNHTTQYADIVSHRNDGSVVQNNVTDTIYSVDTGTNTWFDDQNTNGNITNAAYDAL